MSYQSYCRTPPPEAVSSCFPGTLPHIWTLPSRRYRDSRSTGTQSWTIAYSICLESTRIHSSSLTVELPLFLPPKFCRRRSWTFCFLSKIKNLLLLLLNPISQLRIRMNVERLLAYTSHRHDKVITSTVRALTYNEWSWNRLTMSAIGLVSDYVALMRYRQAKGPLVQLVPNISPYAWNWHV